MEESIGIQTPISFPKNDPTHKLDEVTTTFVSLIVALSGSGRCPPCSAQTAARAHGQCSAVPPLIKTRHVQQSDLVTGHDPLGFKNVLFLLLVFLGFQWINVLSKQGACKTFFFLAWSYFMNARCQISHLFPWEGWHVCLKDRRDSSLGLVRFPVPSRFCLSDPGWKL